MDTPFLIKYRPRNLDDVKTDISIKKLLFDLIKIDNISIILIGESGTGKTSLINCIINEYYKNEAKASKNDNILFVNSIKEQGIQQLVKEYSTFQLTDKQKAQAEYVYYAETSRFLPNLSESRKRILVKQLS